MDLRIARNKKTRREFLRLTGLAVGAAAFSACGGPTPTPVVVEQEKVVKETVEKQVTEIVQVVVTATPYPKPPVVLPVAPVVTPAPEKPIDIAYWDLYGRLVWHGQDLKQVPVDLWNQANPNIRVSYLPGAGAKEKVLTAVASGTPPDLLMTDPPTEYVYRKAVDSLQPYLDRGDHPYIEKDIYPGVWRAMAFKGQVYAIHRVPNNAGMYINADLFQQAGLDPDNPPKTLAEVEECAAKIHKVGSNGDIEILGFSPWLNIAGIWGTWAEAFGAELWDEANNRVTFDEEKSVRALEWQVEYANKFGGYEKILAFNDALAGMDPFGSGRVGIYITGPWQIGIMQDSYPAINYRTSTMPIPDGGRGGSWLGGSWLVMPRGGKNKDITWEFMKWYCGKECQDYEGTQGIGFTIWPEVNEKNEWFNTLEQLKPFIKDLPGCWPIPLIPTVNHAFFTAFNPMVDECLRGKRTPLDAMREATRIAQEEVDRFISNL